MKKTLKTKLGVILFAIVALGVLLYGILGPITGNEYGYFSFSFFILLPVVSFVSSILIDYNHNQAFWITAIIFGTINAVIPCVIVASFFFEPLYFLFCLIPSLLGYGIRSLFQKKSA